MTTLVDWGQYIRVSDAAPLNALYAVLHTQALAAEGPRAFEYLKSPAALKIVPKGGGPARKTDQRARQPISGGIIAEIDSPVDERPEWAK
jgi:hypothetical protein